MSTQQTILDLGRCLRAVAPPLLTLGGLVLSRTASGRLSSANPGELLVAGWRAAVIATLLWLLVAVVLAATQPWRDRRANQRLQRLRERAAQPNRVLVFVQTIVWGTAAGQHVVVINLATGTTHRAWLPETTVQFGTFVVLERSNGGVSVVDWMNAQQVEAGHRHDQRHLALRRNSVERCVELPEHSHDDALLLIEETEQFLREQELRW